MHILIFKIQICNNFVFFLKGEDYEDVIEKLKKGCPNVQLGDHNFEVMMNELSMLKSLVEILSSKVEDGCNKVELVDFKNEMVAMHCEIKELTNFVIMSTGVMDNIFGTCLIDSDRKLRDEDR